jgi:hypothetical protein
VTEFRTAAEWQTHHQKGLAAALHKALEQTEAAYRGQHPEAGALLIKKEIFVYPKRPKGFSSHALDVVGWFLHQPGSLQETNAVSVARLQERYGSSYKVPANLLTRQLPPSTLKRIGKLLAENGRQIDLQANDTVSKIRRALRAKASSTHSGNVYEVEVSFSDQEVVVGDVTFPVQKHEKGYRRIRVPVGKLRRWVRCDVLEALLKKGSQPNPPTK